MAEPTAKKRKGTALLAVMNAAPDVQRAWAEGISAPPSGHTLIEPWQSAFAACGALPSTR